MDLACDIRIGPDNVSRAQFGPGEATLPGPGEVVALEAAPLPEVDDEGGQVRRGRRIRRHDRLNSVPTKKT